MKRKIDQYYIVYEKDEKGGYIASAPAIRGCVVYGKTLKEAYKNINMAIKECLEVIKDYHGNLPKETIKPEVIRKFSFIKIPEYV